MPIRTLLAATLCLAAGWASAQSLGSFDRPAAKVGDVIEYDKFVTVPCARWEITAIAGGTVTSTCGANTATIDEASGALVRIVTKDGDKLVQFKPYAQSLQFPLNVGKSWSGKYEGYTNDDGASWQAEARCSVKGEEKVKVAAGEFDAYRIECEDAWQSGPFSGVSRATSWYAPKARAVVKTVNAEAPKWNMELRGFTSR